MSGEIVRTLDVDKVRSTSVDVKYPYVFIQEADQPFVVIVKLLEEGDIPVVLSYKGRQKVVANISGCASNFVKMFHVVNPIIYYDEDGKEHLLKKPSDYAEVFL